MWTISELSSETDPLLHRRTASEAIQDSEVSKVLQRGEHNASHGEAFDAVPQSKRQLGLWSAVFLIFNRVIGSGIFATPSLILKASGSVGMALSMWVLGILVAAAGTTVFIELGTGIPRSGGEKNYLEFIYRRPKFLMTCAYTMFAMFTGWSAANSVAMGEYVLHAFSVPTTRFNTRLVGFAALTAAFVLHGTRLTWGLRVQNALGVFKLFLLLSIALSGLLSLARVPGFRLTETQRTHNFDSDRVWEGTNFEVNTIVMALYTVIWSFIGYSNANYALSEIRDPVRTIKRAAPLAMFSAAIVYMLVNIAYFSVVKKEEILEGGRIVAALYFRNLFGSATEKILSIFVALSTFGNILAVLFSQGRVVQELGREGILPFSSFFASSKPFNTPFAGLFEQWLVSSIVMLAPPPGDAYNFILALSSYPLAMINTSIAIGLLFLRTPSARNWAWTPPFRAWTPVVVFFFVSNLFLVTAPLIPPAPGSEVFEHLPYWLHVLVSCVIAAMGGVYWYVWAVWKPRRSEYTIEREIVLQDDGVSRNVLKRLPLR